MVFLFIITEIDLCNRKKENKLNYDEEKALFRY